MSDTQTAAPVMTEAAADKAARDAALKQADNFFKGDIKEAPKGNPSDLFKKMAEKLNQDTAQHQDRIDLEKEEIRSANLKDNDEPKSKASLVEDDKKPGYIKSLKQTNDQLAKEAAELKAEVEEYKSKKLPEYEKELQELRSKMDDGGTRKQMEALQKQLDETIKEGQEREEALSNDLEQLRKANAYLNLPAAPVFKETFDTPILQGYNQVRMILNDDQTTLTEFQKGVAAYEASLRTNDQNEKIRQREISKQTFDSIYEILSPMEQAKFNTTAYDILGKVELRNLALQDWETTKARTDEENSRRQNNNKSQLTKRWSDAFSHAKQQLDDAIKYPEDIAKIISSQNIDDDTSEDEMIAEAALRENSNYTPEQITRILQQGAKFKKARAFSFALKKENAELKETIKKMRGSSTSEGSVGSSASGKTSQSDDYTPAGLFAKFRNR